MTYLFAAIYVVVGAALLVALASRSHLRPDPDRAPDPRDEFIDRIHAWVLTELEDFAVVDNLGLTPVEFQQGRLDAIKTVTEMGLATGVFEEE